MQIEPPETIHFPIHSLQELQEQRGGLRVSALGSAAMSPLRGARHGVLEQGRCSRLHGPAKGVLDRSFIESFRKRKLSIGVYTTPHFEN